MLEKCFFFKRSEFCQKLIGNVISKNVYSAGKTSGVLRDGAVGANGGYVLAHCRGGGLEKQKGGSEIHTGGDGEV